MIHFESDYLEGCHPRLLKALCDTNELQTVGYGTDEFCDEAREIVQGLCGDTKVNVHFLVGGTQVNKTLIAAVLRPHQGVLAADCGHIATHESGAIEATGHKVLTVPAVDAKLSAEAVDAYCADHYGSATAEHTVQPGMIFCSNPSEWGTVYSRQELLDLRRVCDKWNLAIYMDGARLGSALSCEQADYDYAFLAEVCDAFTIGGTKLGCLFGEVLVIRNESIHKDFRYILKQNGGMLAKGRLLGVQFRELLRDGLYLEIGRHENELAMLVKKDLTDKGYTFLYDSCTNQQFPIFPNALVEKLSEKYVFSDNGPTDKTHRCVRICTSWATKREDVEKLLGDIPNYLQSLS